MIRVDYDNPSNKKIVIFNNTEEHIIPRSDKSHSFVVYYDYDIEFLTLKNGSVFFDGQEFFSDKREFITTMRIAVDRKIWFILGEELLLGKDVAFQEHIDVDVFMHENSLISFLVKEGD